MKTMKNFLSMAALVLMGAMMTGCSSDDNFDNPQQPENKSNVVTLTTTVSLDANAGTRALDASGHKTFAVGDQIAVIYGNATISRDTKAVSAPLKSTDISADGKTATFTVTLENPIKTLDVFYVYPASFILEDEGLLKLNYDVLYSQQDGTLATLASKCDYSTSNGDWNGDNLPSLTLENQLAILAITLKDKDKADDNEITSSIKSMTVSDGSNTYAVNRTPAAGPIYVAIWPTSNSTITVTATDGTKTYIKTLTPKTYEKGHIYNVSWKMAENFLAKVTADDKGKVIGADGKIYDDASAAGAASTTAVAKIVYVGNETGESPFGFIHGLALALDDAGTSCQWSTSTDITVHTYNATSSSFASESGLQYNDATHNSDTYPAFKAAITYSPAAPTGCSAWFLASGYQWQKMISAAGLSNLGLSEDRVYWSSTEHSAGYAWWLYSKDGSWSPFYKDAGKEDPYKDYHVRACLAF